MTCGKIFFLPRRIFFSAAFLLCAAAVAANEHAGDTPPAEAPAVKTTGAEGRAAETETISHAAPPPVPEGKKETEPEAGRSPDGTASGHGTPPPAARHAAATDTNAEPAFVPPTRLDQLNYTLSLARFSTSTREFSVAEKNYEQLLVADVPEEMQRTALFEMAQVVQTENDLPRAQSMLEQYRQRWPGDARTPEIYLHQGRIFRQMGLHTYALSKFYAVMTTALSLKNDQLPYYKRLVLTAQVEIAETHFAQGHYKDAADYYARLLLQSDPALDRAQIQFRLVRSLSAVQQHAEAVKQAKGFLEHYPESLDEPEVRYHLAQSLKGQGRNADALQQVMIFLHEQREKTKDRPEVWAYWQQRVGNEIGNQLYQDGDFIRALEVYLALSKLDGTPAWQLPVRYQVGITYEKLLQPRLAAAAYRAITNAAPPLGTNLTPGLKSVVDMAQWRLDFLQWHERADDFNRPVEKFPASTNLNLSQQ